MEKEFIRIGVRGQIAKILSFLREYIPLSLGLGRRVGAAKKFPELDETTFLDVTDSKEINVPFYSYSNATGRLMAKTRRENVPLSGRIRILKRILSSNQKEILSSIDEGLPQLTFAYTHFPDAIWHRIWFRPRFIYEVYHDLDYFVYRVKAQLEEDNLFVIISDHGAENGHHSDYGFYSSNKPLHPKPHHITDFFNLFLSWCESTNS